jgi:rRNA maturation endonuclease Nob1
LPAPTRTPTKEDTVAEKVEKVETYNGYCVKCKEKRDFEGTVAISKTGMRMAKGPCPVCGTTVNRILGKA